MYHHPNKKENHHDDEASWIYSSYFYSYFFSVCGPSVYMYIDVEIGIEIEDGEIGIIILILFKNPTFPLVAKKK